ncbi:MAG: dethiobiotin synthase [Pseudomonadales bacterium]|jgi:dethiobiotin synthetase|nr:dethiobiotin synthase [Pseudomonadales bacterium]MCP5337069.1 dethiobiotin synthase [Pseudomonadales bacterium]
MTERVFVTGTDTGVGKSLVAAALLVAAGSRGMRTIGLKPLAAGARRTVHGLRNDDAELLQRTMNQALPYHEVNPVALEPAIAPHLALAAAGVRLTARELHARCEPALQRACDFVVVEGAGGWRVPLADNETLADLARLLGFPVVLVVGIRLGCLNHALLSAAAIRADGLRLAGWVANVIDPRMPYIEDNVATLDALLGAPRLGLIPWQAGITAELVAPRLDLSPLLRDRA